MLYERILKTVAAHDTWRSRFCLNLISSENIQSPMVKKLLTSDMGSRYTARDHFYMGTKYMDGLQAEGERLAREVFGAEHTFLEPLSGHIADLAVLSIFARPGDKLLCVGPDDGGYPGISALGFPRWRPLRVIHFPFDRERMEIDLERSLDLIRQEKPKVIVLGASFLLFPQPVRELAREIRSTDSVLVYDGSHVLGLIAGGEFQNPLKEGADLLIGSTHKSLFGPQGGLILATKDAGHIVSESLFPGLIDNAHWNRIAALTVALAEARRFGGRYAAQVVRNARVLGQALNRERLPVSFKSRGYTRSHQVFLDFGGYKKGREVAVRLEEANIITDSGIRLGTNEVTRWGMKEPEMDKIAELLARVIIHHESPAAIRKEVLVLRNSFSRLHYCFEGE